MEFILPQGSFKFNTEAAAFVTACAGGRKPAVKWLQSAAGQSEIYCADKGLEICLDAGLAPQLVCGDADSVDKAYLQKAQEQKIKTVLCNPAKDDTDLQLLLTMLPQKIMLLATGVWGGRFDHLYSNVFSLLNFKLERKTQVIMADEQEAMALLGAGDSVVFTPSVKLEAVSLLPLSDCVVSISGVRWPLQNAPLQMLQSYAISNEQNEKQIEIKCLSGCVGFYVKTADCL